jgi:protease YdgD
VRAGAALCRAVLALPVLAGAAAAQPPPRVVPPALLPGLGAADPRRPVSAAAAPWHALGRVQREIGGRCTGALIGPRTVLTAAHCLVAPRTRTLVQPGSVHFLLGYDRGAWRAHARVAAFTVGEGYRPAGGGAPSADWALLTLDRAVATADRALPLLGEAPPPRTPLMLGGYQQDRPETLLADTACRALGLRRDGAGQAMLMHDCAGTRGVSGAPLLAPLPDGRWAIAGVASVAALDLALGAAVPAPAVVGGRE